MFSQPFFEGLVLSAFGILCLAKDRCDVEAWVCGSIFCFWLLLDVTLPSGRGLVCGVSVSKASGA